MTKTTYNSYYVNLVFRYGICVYSSVHAQVYSSIEKVRSSRSSRDMVTLIVWIHFQDLEINTNVFLDQYYKATVLSLCCTWRSVKCTLCTWIDWCWSTLDQRAYLRPGTASTCNHGGSQRRGFRVKSAKSIIQAHHEYRWSSASGGARWADRRAFWVCVS